MRELAGCVVALLGLAAVAFLVSMAVKVGVETASVVVAALFCAVSQ